MGEEGQGRGNGPRVMSLAANQSRMMTSLRTVSPSRAICLFPSRMLRVPIRLTLYDRGVSISLLDNSSRVWEQRSPMGLSSE
jgi:hypothetical protein